MLSSFTCVCRVLYRRLLRLHKRLPEDLRAVGLQFVREEFKKHKDAEPEFVPKFMAEWTVRGNGLMAVHGSNKGTSINQSLRLNTVLTVH